MPLAAQALSNTSHVYIIYSPSLEHGAGHDTHKKSLQPAHGDRSCAGDLDLPWAVRFAAAVVVPALVEHFIVLEESGHAISHKHPITRSNNPEGLATAPKQSSTMRARSWNLLKCGLCQQAWAF